MRNLRLFFGIIEVSIRMTHLNLAVLNTYETSFVGFIAFALIVFWFLIELVGIIVYGCISLNSLPSVIAYCGTRQNAALSSVCCYNHCLKNDF